MKKTLTLLLFILCMASISIAQTPAGGYSSPAAGSSTGSSNNAPASSLFYIASSCAGLTNCLAWVDDDTTDNCGAATTAFLTAINAYAGPGESRVSIQGSGSGKAYKLASCNLAFTGPAGTGGQVGSVSVVSNATIDCAQASGNCIQMGKTGCSTVSFYGTGCHDVTWRGGTITNCVGLTTGCFEVEQGMFINIIDDVTFVNTGAGNATLGTCTNYSVQWDTFVGGMEFSRNKYFGTVKGQCFSNNNDATGGANTITFTNNAISHTTGAACGGILHFDSSSHSTIENNLLFGFGALIDLMSTTNGTEGGWLIGGNNLDTGGCTIPAGVAASIQFGIPSNGFGIGPVTVSHNNGFTSPLIAQYPGSTSQMQGWAIVGNNNQSASTSNLIGGNTVQTTCNQYATQPCYISANPGYAENNLTAGQGGAVYAGFLVQTGNMGHFFQTAQAANFGPSNLNSGAVIGGLSEIYCVVIVSQQATTSATAPSCTIGWTDLLTSTAQTSTVVASGFGGTNPVAGAQAQGRVYAAVKANTNVTVTTASYASVGATPMQYAVFADIQKAY